MSASGDLSGRQQGQNSLGHLTPQLRGAAARRRGFSGSLSSPSLSRSEASRPAGILRGPSCIFCLPKKKPRPQSKRLSESFASLEAKPALLLHRNQDGRKPSLLPSSLQRRSLKLWVDLANMQTCVCVSYLYGLFFPTQTKLPPLARIVYLLVCWNRGENDVRFAHQETGNEVKRVNKSKVK